MKKFFVVLVILALLPNAALANVLNSELKVPNTCAQVIDIGFSARDHDTEPYIVCVQQDNTIAMVVYDSGFTGYHVDQVFTLKKNGSLLTSKDYPIRNDK